MAESIVKGIVSKLTDVELKEVLLMYSVDEQVEIVTRELSRIQFFLKDADKKQITDERQKFWMKQVRDVAYFIQDTIETFLLEIPPKPQKPTSTMETMNRMMKIIKKLPVVRKFVKEIEEIQRMMTKIEESICRYGINTLGEDSGEMKLPISPFVLPDIDPDIVGFKEDQDHVVKQLLDETTERRSVVSIWGAGGLGKTTLAQKVYNCNDVKRQFELRIWVAISRKFKLIDILRKIAKQVPELSINPGMQLNVFLTKIHESLKDKKYLIVLDDVWTDYVWTQIGEILPNKNNGSRVLITTRIFDVAKDADPICEPYKLGLLTKELSLQLFLKRALPNQDLNKNDFDDLSDIIDHFLHKCDGLPLALVVLGGLLSKKSHSYAAWNKVLRTMSWHADDGKKCSEIIGTSYEDLSFVLKLCFMYFSVFPENYNIEAQLLVQLWVAEGFILQEDNRTLEKTAKSYLEDLVQRNLVQVRSRSLDGSIRECSIHDLLLDLAIQKAKEDNFFGKYSHPNDQQSLSRLRHLAVHHLDCDKLVMSQNLRLDCDKLVMSQNLRTRGHKVDEVSIFGRDVEKMEVIDFLLSEKENSFSVISIVGKGGIGKTTIAEFVYKDLRDSRCFDLFGWVCVSKVFDVRRLIKATVESVCKINYGVSALIPLQEELAETMKGKTILLVLDNVWNENQSLWELFQVSFKEARMVRILVTTRNKNVADVMQSTCFSPSNLPESSCWQLFEHYAFSGRSNTVPTHLVDMGKEIMRKCGGLPLAVRLIASLLSHETDVEGWREILKSDLWESNASNDIFPALEISYAHLPGHLKPCLLFCSLYPIDYKLEKMKLIELWISHGYIVSKGNRRITEIGGEYYEELKERLFLDDCSTRSLECCKLHDIIHDLARINSENEHYSVEINHPLDIRKGNVPREVYHLYARGFSGYVNQMLQQNQQNLIGLRTLSMDLRRCSSQLEHQYCIQNTKEVDLNLKELENYEECFGEVTICNLIEFQALTVMELKGYNLTHIPDFIFKLTNLAYLCITSSRLKMLPLSIGLLCNLQTLILDCFSLEYLPKSIGNLANLQRLVIRSDDLEEVPLEIKNLCNLHALTIRSNRIQALPNTIGSLSSLEELKLLSLDGSYDDLPDGKLDYVPHGFVNFPAIKTMAAWLGVRTINWLKDMKDLEGKLSIGGLKNMSNLEDAQHANLINKWKLETLDLCWDPGYYISPYDAKSELRLSLIPEACKGELVCPDVVSLSFLECLQPHPNLKKLLVRWYPSATVPNWMRDPSSFQSIQEVLLECCVNIQSLPFENFHTLKHLTIVACSSIRVLQLEQVSSQLEKLLIVSCDNVELITGLGDLYMLAAIEIYSCQALKSLTMGGKQLVLSTETFGDSSHEKPHTGQQSIASLGRLEIKNCELLCVLPDGLIPPGPCYVCVHGCGCPDLERNLVSAINEISCSSNLWRWR